MTFSSETTLKKGDNLHFPTGAKMELFIGSEAWNLLDFWQNYPPELWRYRSRNDRGIRVVIARRFNEEITYSKRFEASSEPSV